MAFALTIVKAMQYRGNNNEEYSNRYCMAGTTPATETDWFNLVDTLSAAEAEVVPNDVIYKRAYGYTDTDATTNSSWTGVFDGSDLPSLAGGLDIGTGDEMPGDCAVWVRWKLDKLNSNGKAVYLRKYFHPALQGGNADGVYGAQRTALLAFGAFMRDPANFGGTHEICAPDGTTTVGHNASSFITTRTLKRRGKRTPS